MQHFRSRVKFGTLMALARTLAVATLAASGHALKVAHAPALKPVLVLRGGFNPIAPLAKAYAAQLAIAPMATNVATAAALSVVADGVAQKPEGLDVDVVLRVARATSVASGPTPTLFLNT